MTPADFFSFSKEDVVFVLPAELFDSSGQRIARPGDDLRQMALALAFDGASGASGRRMAGAVLVDFGACLGSVGGSGRG